jgi:signal transduction histidine kinase
MPGLPDIDSAALGRIVASKAMEIEGRWLERVAAEIAGQRDVHPTLLRDGMPDYLAELARLLSGAHDSAENGSASWIRVAREHGITRVRVGFDIEQLVREFVMLRKVIEELGQEVGALTGHAASTLADLIDAAIAKSVSAYVETRDYEARRRQAENVGFLIHELRNPLSSAMAAATVVRQGSDPAQRKPLDMLERSQHRLTELIDSVLLTEKLEAGRLEPSPVEVRVAELVDRATTAARRTAQAKGVPFNVHCDPERTVRTDIELTQSALQNLVDNAVKYTDAGRVDVAVELEPEASWSVHVRDSCPGLSQEELSTIFEPFKRGHTAKAGTGLGLAIARRAIEAQGGRIHAESPGVSGCHFWFTLPQ